MPKFTKRLLIENKYRINPKILKKIIPKIKFVNSNKFFFYI